MSKLAIVIPAYKTEFLSQTLNSLSRQTCKDFVVYIGDDASPYDIKSIVDGYKDRINLLYYRFEDNLGGKDLVGQWERCIELTQNEKWIWLFSDDDEMEPYCVELFYNVLKCNKQYDLYHFDVDVIDEFGNVISRSNFPDWISSAEFAVKKLRGKISSYVVEYIFSRDVYEECDNFQKFDLAWGSDDASWVKFGRKKGIKTIKDGHVRWRKSSFNITPNIKDINVVQRKIEANLEFLSWLNEELNHRNIYLSLLLSEVTWFSVNIIKYKEILTRRQQKDYLVRMCSVIKQRWLFPFVYIYFLLK